MSDSPDDAEEKMLASLFHDIGKFMFRFSQLEFTIRHMLADVLNVSDEQFTATTGMYDFRMLCTVTCQMLKLKHVDKDGLHGRIDKIFNDCQSLNNDRVRIAHGLWVYGVGGPGVVHVNRQTLQSKRFFDKPGSAAARSGEAQRLMAMMLAGFPSTGDRVGEKRIGRTHTQRGHGDGQVCTNHEGQETKTARPVKVSPRRINLVQPFAPLRQRWHGAIAGMLVSAYTVTSQGAGDSPRHVEFAGACNPPIAKAVHGHPTIGDADTVQELSPVTLECHGSVAAFGEAVE